MVRRGSTCNDLAKTILLEVAVAAKMTGRRSAQNLLMSQPANYTSHLTRTLLWSVISDFPESSMYVSES